jgi:hypothetical protein
MTHDKIEKIVEMINDRYNNKIWCTSDYDMIGEYSEHEFRKMLCKMSDEQLDSTIDQITDIIRNVAKLKMIGINVGICLVYNPCEVKVYTSINKIEAVDDIELVIDLGKFNKGDIIISAGDFSNDQYKFDGLDSFNLGDGLELDITGLNMDIQSLDGLLRISKVMINAYGSLTDTYKGDKKLRYERYDDVIIYNEDTLNKMVDRLNVLSANYHCGSESDLLHYIVTAENLIVLKMVYGYKGNKGISFEDSDIGYLVYSTLYVKDYNIMVKMCKQLTKIVNCKIRNGIKDNKVEYTEQYLSLIKVLVDGVNE